jgi:beta-lactamase class A
LIAAVLFAAAAAVPSAAASPPLPDEIREIARSACGTVGVAAAAVESGERFSLRGGERFPMMSVYKLPIALALLHSVEEGKASLDEKIEIRPSDLRLGNSPIADRHPEGGVTLTVRELLEDTLIESDNTASDILLREAGGGAAVTARLRALGVEGIRVDRPEAWLAFDGAGIRDAPPEAAWTLAGLRRLFDAQPPEEKARAIRAFVEDPRDTATPDAMVDLLVLLARGKAVDASNTARVINLMARTKTGAARIMARLPMETPVVHRTGLSMTVGGFTAAINDVGLVSPPDGPRFAIAVFVKGCGRPVPEAEDAIARIARAAYDRFAAARAPASP